MNHRLDRSFFIMGDVIFFRNSPTEREIRERGDVEGRPARVRTSFKIPSQKSGCSGLRDPRSAALRWRRLDNAQGPIP